MKLQVSDRSLTKPRGLRGDRRASCEVNLCLINDQQLGKCTISKASTFDMKDVTRFGGARPLD